MAESARGPAKPTLVPALTALGIALLAWGGVSSFLIAASGFIVLLVGFVGWIREISNERTGV